MNKYTVDRFNLVDGKELIANGEEFNTKEDMQCGFYDMINECRHKVALAHKIVAKEGNKIYGSFTVGK